MGSGTWRPTPSASEGPPRERPGIGTAHAGIDPAAFRVAIQALVALDVYHHGRAAVEARERSPLALREVFDRCRAPGWPDLSGLSPG